MNPAITKIAEKGIRQSFELLIGDYLITQKWTEDSVKIFASSLVSLAEKASRDALVLAIRAAKRGAQRVRIEESLKNPKISQ